MISKHLKDIKKLLKAYQKKYTWEGKPVRKPTKGKEKNNDKEKNGCIANNNVAYNIPRTS
jgi:hypothetical protein